jgi:DnaK suppressor protein
MNREATRDTYRNDMPLMDDQEGDRQVTGRRLLEGAAPADGRRDVLFSQFLPLLNARHCELQQQPTTFELEHDIGCTPSSNGLADVTQVQDQRQSMAGVRAIRLAELRQIEHVLQRAASNLYGICERCGNEIPPRRLRVVPAATLCVECQATDESQRGANAGQLQW